VALKGMCDGEASFLANWYADGRFKVLVNRNDAWRVRFEVTNYTVTEGTVLFPP
jgi:hypothetical protein